MVEIAKAMDLMMETTYSPTIICCIGIQMSVSISESACGHFGGLIGVPPLSLVRLYDTALCSKVVSRGWWPKIQYLSFVPFLHTLVLYPNQRLKTIGQNSNLRFVPF